MGYRPVPTSPISEASGPGDRVKWDKVPGYALNAEDFIESILDQDEAFAAWFRKREAEREEARELYR
jgi:hypothetical protein